MFRYVTGVVHSRSHYGLFLFCSLSYRFRSRFYYFQVRHHYVLVGGRRVGQHRHERRGNSYLALSAKG